MCQIAERMVVEEHVLDQAILTDVGTFCADSDDKEETCVLQYTEPQRKADEYARKGTNIY